MRPNSLFLKQPKYFWAYVRSLSEKIGYTNNGKVKAITIDEMAQALSELNLKESVLFKNSSHLSDLGKHLRMYFKYRANVINKYVKPRLMDDKQAKIEFTGLRKKLKPKCPLPMNKQKGSKKQQAFFSGIINMLIEKNLKGYRCDYDPRNLTSFTSDGTSLRTMSRRIDGAFPYVVDPIAVWEIKEYYYTTTFGSRVADGVYETLLDGMELEEMRLNEQRECKHYLMIDAKYTWWDCGKSYLCRIIDMLNMGFIDEVFFGREVLERLPGVVSSWVETLEKSK